MSNSVYIDALASNCEWALCFTKENTKYYATGYKKYNCTMYVDIFDKSTGKWREKVSICTRNLIKTFYEYKNINGNTYESDELLSYNTITEALKLSRKEIKTYKSKLDGWGHSNYTEATFSVYVDPEEDRELRVEIRRVPNPNVANDTDNKEIRYVYDIQKQKGSTTYKFKMTSSMAHYKLTLYAIVDGQPRVVDQSPAF